MFKADDYEKLGSFFLGRVLAADGSPTDAPLLYDAKDMTTHGVCVGMTGSGKTGLCLALLEEAAIDGIPALVIDPKGDLGNLLLTFPALRSEDFAPWIDPAEAARAGQAPAEYAATVAERWRKGLADWGQAPARIQALRDAADIAIYTPGSTAGRPLRLLRSFDAPPPALAAEPEAVRERLQAAVSSLLALLGIDADPIQSRESILLQNILDTSWKAGQNLDLAALIRAIQAPPFERVGVFDLESFYPAKERMTLAMKLNNLLASPGFGAWLEGEPLDIARLLYTPEGKPRLCVLSIAHLSEAERMFFVTLLLSELIAWMRGQPGTQSLRALLYMDEIFGYFPPTANPPSKQPMLTLLKQARAYGVGVVLATQNPVDLDYKGLANTGTWFLGRLQTERDKLRVLEGLEGASSATGKAFDRGAMERTLAGLGNRMFLMHNVHDDAPTLFESRWAMSYLRGPLTREQIRKLTQAGAPPVTTALAAPALPVAPVAAAPSVPRAPTALPRPNLPTGIEERFAAAPAAGTSAGLVYEPALFATASAHYVHAPAKLDAWQSLTFSARLDEASAAAPWEALSELPGKPALAAGPEPGASFAPLPALAERPPSYTRWAKMLESRLLQTRPLVLYECRSLKAFSSAGESLGDFRVRLRDRIAPEPRPRGREAAPKMGAEARCAARARAPRAGTRRAREGRVLEQEARDRRLDGRLRARRTLRPQARERHQHRPRRERRQERRPRGTSTRRHRTRRRWRRDGRRPAQTTRSPIPNRARNPPHQRRHRGTRNHRTLDLPPQRRPERRLPDPALDATPELITNARVLPNKEMDSGRLEGAQNPPLPNYCGSRISTPSGRGGRRRNGSKAQQTAPLTKGPQNSAHRYAQPARASHSAPPPPAPSARRKPRTSRTNRRIVLQPAARSHPHAHRPNRPLRPRSPSRRPLQPPRRPAQPRRKRLERHRRPAEAPPRAHSQSRRNREGLREPRAEDAAGRYRRALARDAGRQCAGSRARGGELSRSIGALFAVAEAYPQLRANENFVALQGQLAQLEEAIQNARRYYNAIVRDLNTATESFPSNLVANAFGFSRREYFELDSAAERSVPKVSFGA